MNGYLCFYHGVRVEVEADTSYEAQCEAARVLGIRNPRHRCQIAVCLCEVNGKQVKHLPLM